MREQDVIVTEVGGSGDEVIKRLIDIEDGDPEIRELPRQRLRRRVDLPVELLRVVVEESDAPVAAMAVQRPRRRHAAQRRQVGHADPASS